jgi:hypothetical protein
MPRLQPMQLLRYPPCRWRMPMLLVTWPDISISSACCVFVEHKHTSFSLDTGTTCRAVRRVRACWGLAIFNPPLLWGRVPYTARSGHVQDSPPLRRDNVDISRILCHRDERQLGRNGLRSNLHRRLLCGTLTRRLLRGGRIRSRPPLGFRSRAGVTQRATRVAIAFHHGRQPSSPAFLLPRDRRCDSSVNMHIGNQKP